MSDASDKEIPRTPLLEWIAASAGALVAAGLIGYLTWHGLTGADAPADLVIRVDSIEATSAGFRVEISLVNQGDRTAAAATVKSFSEADGEAEITFDFVPGSSVRHGTLLFREQPSPDRLDLRVVGFREP
ncbi:MAG TPA: hypothetical protein VHL31_00680 [Geminicoccus sp.]|jgi:uncharacterized protein (TIGR02588 family)|uniref:hypothetical protein n=1 Tax=Geminicoccus sp. TaxID=2024832 RepID=UPI002E30FBB9|nr:hypothetical protein [Geminicoccus sp.]HEX2524805.1 hypothetical protein [Geminicoccus sp.]